MAFGRTAPVVSLLVLAGASFALAGPVGPVYPPPGGVDWSALSANATAAGRSGGQTWQYQNFDFSAFDEMWWGPWNATEVKLAFDGAFDSPGETMTFSVSASNASAGVAVWTGSVTVALATGGTQTLSSRFTVKSATLTGTPIAMVDATAVGITSGSGLVVPVNGDYKANFVFEVFRNGVWQPAADAYDQIATVPNAQGLRMSFSAGFFYTPVCGDGIAEGDEQCDDGEANGTITSCCTSSCSFEQASVACDDGNLCSQTDECDGAGTCVGSDPVVCTPLDQCHVAGQCDASTGICSNPVQPDGMSCDDADACSLHDTCQSGSCTPGGPTLLDPLEDPGQTLECLLMPVPAP
jgi:hypothetical protein